MARREELDVGRLPPPWRRSLTESGMRSRPTTADRLAVVVFLLGLIGVVAWIIHTLSA